MKKKLQGTILLALFSIGVMAQTVPTWSGDVACIVYSHCSSCHNPNSIAPFSLLTYQDAYLNRFAMQNDVTIGKMPPYLPNTNYQHYTDMRTLTAQEVRTISDWVNAGAPIGDTTLAPPQPTFTPSAGMSNPDLTARIPDYVVPNTGNDLYRCFVITPPTNASNYISEIEVIPGDRSAVHHVLVMEDTAYKVVTLDSADANPGYTNFGGSGSSTSKLMFVWVPGSSVYRLPAGTGIKMQSGSRIVIQIHYPLTAVGKLDSTRVNIKYNTAAGLRDVSLAPVLSYYTNTLTDGPLVIPADSIRTFHEQYTVPVNVTVLSIGPHAHLLCRSMKSYFVTPANDTVPLIEIDNWDFHWQGSHSFQRPIKIPAGSVIHGEALYDNTVNNPNSPRPITTVRAGEATTNEMMLFYFAYLVPYVAGDENVIIDTTSHQPHYLNCVSSYTSPSGILDLEPQIAFRVYPIPAQSILNYESTNEVKEISITDLAGKTVKQLTVSDRSGQLNIGEMSIGLYFIKLKDQNGTVYTQRFVKE